MPHFVSRSQAYAISTSYKVLYSLLDHQPALAMVSPERLLFETYWRQIRWLRQRLLLVRDPYDRIESFFKDKLRKHPAKRLNSYDELQSCQRILCPHLEIAVDDSPAVIQNKLLNVSFDRFVRLLPRIHHLEAHLHPQVWTRRCYWRDRVIWSISFTRILKVESPADMDYLEKRLSVDLSKMYNSTASVPLSDPWSRSLRAVVNEIYQPDFEAFGYELK